jgi:hypothetical protein
MSFGLGSMLGMMGSVPVTKSGDIIFNKLKAAKTLEAGDLGDLMKKTLGQGLKSLLQNPMAASGGKAKQSAQDASSKIDQKSYPRTSDAIEGVMAAIDGVVAMAGDLVGVGKDPNSLLYNVAATNTLDTLGKAEPAWSPATLLKPAISDPEMLYVSDELDRIATELLAGALTDVQAYPQIQALNTLLAQIMVNSKAARRVSDTYAAYLSSVSVLSGLLSGGSPEWQATILKALKDEIRDEVLAANQEFLRVE